MNKLKITCLAAAFALAGAGVSQAQTNYIRLVGATAFRAQTITAITNMMGSTRQVAYYGEGGKVTASTKANQIILGGTVNGSYTIIKAKFGGSAAGIQQVSQAIPIAFMADSNLQAAPSDGSVGSPSYDAAIAPDAAFSDVEQATTPFADIPLDQSPSSPQGV
ncbi:MAG: hypothetical protein ACOYMV_10835, partial [Verrucomicrobiia bacterium]